DLPQIALRARRVDARIIRTGDGRGRFKPAALRLRYPRPEFARAHPWLLDQYREHERQLMARPPFETEIHSGETFEPEVEGGITDHEHGVRVRSFLVAG